MTVLKSTFVDWECGKEMDTARFSTIADQFLPGSLAGAMPDDLCAKLARTHYENFPVGSILQCLHLLPRLR